MDYGCFNKNDKRRKTVSRRLRRKKWRFFKRSNEKSFFEKIEDEYDIALADAGLREYEKDPKTYSHKEIMEKYKL